MKVASGRSLSTLLLRIPPFPGATIGALAVPAEDRAAAAGEAEAVLAALCHHRVGGSFWAAQPPLDARRRLVARPADRAQWLAMLARAQQQKLEDRILLWLPETLDPRGIDAGGCPIVTDPCDPWHLIDHAEAIWSDAADEVTLLARIAGTDVVGFGDGPFDGRSPTALVQQHLLDGLDYVDPFDGARSDAAGIVALLGSWRALIDGNRPIAAAVGFARWKRDTVEPLLWNGAERVRFEAPTERLLSSLAPTGTLAAWKSRVPLEFLAEAESEGAALVDVEDGFIRSCGLGANCVPPLSIVVDRLGAHFDPSGPSELEAMLETREFDAATLAQAEQLRAAIRESGLSKYETGTQVLERPGGDRRHILVPGQVEDDRSVLCGGGGIESNLELLRRVRKREPDAFIIYKPHPDVEAGHRKGRLSEAEAGLHADLIVRDAPISALLDMVDGVHVLTSLAGFEALLRDTPVTTHGVPFYAGWGLTSDLGVVPARRTRKRSLTELVAAVLIAYPRYLDPVTMLPCPPEVLVSRLTDGVRRQNETIVSFRRMQGAVRRSLSRIGAPA